MSLYTMKLSDSVDTMEFNLLEVPIQDKDIEGAVDNVVLSGDIYTDFLWLKKRFTHKWSILCKDDYERLRGFYTRQFSNAEVPIYQLLDAPSPIEESAGSGEYIQITTTDSTAKLASVEMLGKAEQDGTPTPDSPVPISTTTGENVVKIEGKNLCQLETSATKTVGGLTFTTDGGYININGTASVTGEFYFDEFKAPSGTATFSATVSGYTDKTSSNSSIILQSSPDGTTWSSASVIWLQSTEPKSETITLDSALHYRIRFRVTSASVFTNATIKPQLELGSTATAYEPYHGQEFEVNLGKNLLDPDSISQGTWINASLTNTCTFFMPIFTGETFTISNQDTSTYRFSCGLCVTPHAGTNTQDSGWQTGTSYTITAQSNGYLYVQLRKNDASTITPSTVPTNAYMIERGSQATSFAPYFTPIELAKIGNYQDRIYKDDGKWYIEKQVGKVAININGYNSAYTNVDYAIFDKPADALNYGTYSVMPALCESAVSPETTGGYNQTAQIGRLCSQANQTHLWIGVTKGTTQATAKTMLDGKAVYYALATPTTTEITNEALIAQLDALGASSLYLGVNNIGTETQNAVPTLALTYFPYYPHEIISPKAVRMELTDGGIINACECRENVQITLRETIQ